MQLSNNSDCDSSFPSDIFEIYQERGIRNARVWLLTSGVGGLRVVWGSPGNHSNSSCAEHLQIVELLLHGLCSGVPKCGSEAHQKI